ncbi:MAG TPA: hypothetical protein K8V11_03525 [Dietzia timorensis]|uniref:Uncharacterized protein n=1 Tax=Dietzia timorensis TaxID=499555 RepID=A0A921JXE5_9ACTN|nr:hypothetical protein [Dietzia timorensis]HJE90064.1 hypothetical protein [Dietzia timorensis]
MSLLQDVLLFFHLIFLAALLGGYFVSLTAKGLSNPVMLWGGRLQLVVGLLLYGVLIARSSDLGFEVNHMIFGMKIVIALVLVALIEIATAGQRRAGQLVAAGPPSAGAGATAVAVVRAPLIYVAGVLAIINVILGMSA